MSALGTDFARDSELDLSPDLAVALDGQTAVVLGGSGSIGEEIALRLLQNGARVAVASRSADSISQRMSEALEREERLVFLESDATSEERIADLAQRVENQYGAPEILVLAQGIQHRSAILDCSLDDWNRIIQTNLTAAFLACRTFGPPMLERGHGRVIALTSLTSEIGISAIGPYAASKGGLSQLMRTVAIEWAARGVTVNSIAPGRIRTRMTEELLEDESVLANNLRCIPQGRLGAVEDVSGAALFLCSKAASYITGQTLFVDGGWLAGGGAPLA